MVITPVPSRMNKLSPFTTRVTHLAGVNHQVNIFWLMVWNIFVFLSRYWEFHHPNWQTHIFQRGRYTTKSTYMNIYDWFLLHIHISYVMYGYICRMIYRHQTCSSRSTHAHTPSQVGDWQEKPPPNDNEVLAHNSWDMEGFLKRVYRQIIQD